MGKPREREDWEKPSSQWISEQRIKVMSKEDVVKHYKKKLNFAAMCILFLFVMGYATILAGAYYCGNQQDELENKYIDRTYKMSEIICENINETHIATFSKGNSLIVECSDTNILIEVNKDGNTK